MEKKVMSDIERSEYTWILAASSNIFMPHLLQITSSIHRILSCLSLHFHHVAPIATELYHYIFTTSLTALFHLHLNHQLPELALSSIYWRLPASYGAFNWFLLCSNSVCSDVPLEIVARESLPEANVNLLPEQLEQPGGAYCQVTVALPAQRWVPPSNQSWSAVLWTNHANVLQLLNLDRSEHSKVTSKMNH